MKPTTLRWTARISAFLVLGVADAARRPYYGGTLRIELRAQIRSLDPKDPTVDPTEFAAKALLSPLVFEPLVRFDEKGEVRPLLASSWERTASGGPAEWTFHLRGALPGDAPVTAISAPGDQTPERILRENTRWVNAPVVRNADGTIAGAGPFKISRWDPGKSGTLVANEEYWGGRPYLDSIEIQMGRDLKDQALDLTLGKTDVTETGERNGRLVSTLALIVDNNRDNDRISPATREAISLAIDRAPIQRVLAKSGEATQALLPRRLSGYAFLFAKDRDVARARQLAAGAPALTFLYDRQDATIRRIAERITVNAMEAGIAMRPVVTGLADVRLALLPITLNDPLASLEDLADLLKTPLPPAATAYEAERSLLDGARMIPVIHLPGSWTASPRVHNWPDLANTWISPR